MAGAAGLVEAAGSGPRVAAVGGGHGLARTLEALATLPVQPTAIVSVADDGGSSGRLRRDRDLVALGDLRMALDALATDSAARRLFTHRFSHGPMEGHALGNLGLLALLEQRDGDLVAALRDARELLRAAGSVVPCTTAAVHLGAIIDGEEVRGQVAIATTPGTKSRLWLEPPDAPACPQAVTAIAEADAIVLGPGSLFTSIIPNLLVPGIARAIASSSAPLIYVANLTTQPGETQGLTLQGHLDALLAHLPAARPTTIVLHDGPTPAGPGEPLGVAVSGPNLTRVCKADLAARRADGTAGAGHDAALLAPVLADAIGLH